MNKPVDKPEPPAPSECCENGCEPCVWDLYREALKEWNDQQKAFNKDETLKTSID